MKKADVPQEESMLEGHQRACYALDTPLSRLRAVIEATAG